MIHLMMLRRALYNYEVSPAGWVDKVSSPINKDADASIFKAAHFGVVGDWKKVLPAFSEKVKEFMAGYG